MLRRFSTKITSHTNWSIVEIDACRESFHPCNLARPLSVVATMRFIFRLPFILRIHWGLTAVTCLFVISAASQAGDRIAPSTSHPCYWQYKGEEILLLGGSVDDTLFQLPGLADHLDEMQAVGANSIRNTMSDRHDRSSYMNPFRKLNNARFDLNQWNDEY
jgi:hypothetical protein